MPIVDLDRDDKLDRIHAQRMIHALSQIVFRLIGLEDLRVDDILSDYSVIVMPGPRAGLEYPPGATQILKDELALENLLRASPKKPVVVKKVSGKKAK